jgi:hypothetical protein
MKRVLWGLLVVSLFSMVMGCGNKDVGMGTSNESFGHLKLALNGCAPHYDVVGVQVKLFRDTTKACTDVADIEKTTDLICVPDPIADALFVLPTGDYKVCAIPVKNTDTPPYVVPSSVCSTVFSSPVTVIAEVVKEITLTSLCSNPNGGLDVITNFKDLVLITGLTILPNKFITTCDKATISITVDDPNVVNTYDWTITLSPLGSNPKLTKLDPPWSAEFTTDMPGEYQVQVEVTNPAGNTTSLKEIPIHVSACVG